MQQKKFFRLTLFLLLSGLLNCLMGITLFLWWSQDHFPFTIETPLEETASSLNLHQTNQQMLEKMQSLSIDELVPFLHNTTLIEEGYTLRDLALGTLVSSHYFDLRRALGDEFVHLAKRVMVYQSHDQLHRVLVFPGLSDTQFNTILTFFHKEKYPLTTQGLFLKLQQAPQDDLKLLFTQTPEFYSMMLLFERTQAPLLPETLLKIMLEGDWATLATFHQRQKISQEFTVEMRQQYLIEYALLHSQTAAETLITTDGAQLVSRLDDPTICQILPLLNTPSEENLSFVETLFHSSRGDRVLELAADRLHAFTGSYPQQAPPPILTPPPPEKQDTLYIVQEGDSLWTIALRYRTDPHTLQNHNHLLSDIIRPGMTLRIP
ncbi:MAG: LysM peptidoglycan-binding domain-containing protein [Chlamydiia bacterium]|nr:LysM peptidoglycan-binding domain-containing protein [Chlamydiia bacterium]